MVATKRLIVMSVLAAGLALGPAAAVRAAEGGKPWLGVMLGGTTESGVRVQDVVADSAAARAGLEDGDVIRSIDGKTVHSMSEVTEAIAARRAGDTVRLGIERGGKSLEKMATLGERSEAEAGAGWSHPWPHRFAFAVPKVHLGITLQDLSDGLRGFFRAPADQGVMVSEVAPGSPAEKAGLKPGDVILAVNGKAVSSSGELREEAGRLEAGKTASLRVLREGSERTVDIVPEERKSEGGCPKHCPKECCAAGCGAMGMLPGSGHGRGFGPGPGAHFFEMAIDPAERSMKELKPQIEKDLLESLEKSGVAPGQRRMFRWFGSDAI